MAKNKLEKAWEEVYKSEDNTVEVSRKLFNTIIQLLDPSVVRSNGIDIMKMGLSDASVNLRIALENLEREQKNALRKKN